MKLADTFIPTAGSVGLLPMVAYFVLVMAMYIFLGNFLFAWQARTTIRPTHQVSLMAVVTAVTGISYFLIQGFYQDILVELSTLTDADNHPVLIRESYNAISQYWYMAWAITTPLLLIQLVGLLQLNWANNRSQLFRLILAGFVKVLTSYLGSQQLAFDNEILVGPRLIWGVVSLASYGVIVVTLRQVGKQAAAAPASAQQAYRWMALTLTTVWGVELAGYMLTAAGIDTNWLLISTTLGDVVSTVGMSLAVYWTDKETWASQRPT